MLTNYLRTFALFAKTARTHSSRAFLRAMIAAPLTYKATYFNASAQP